MTLHRVAVTGFGIVSVLGCTPERVAESMRLMRSGVVVDEERRRMGFRSPLTGRIDGFDERGLLTRKQRKSMTDFAVWAHSAVHDALVMSALDPQSLRNGETGLVFGGDSSCVAAVEQVGLLESLGDTTSMGSGHVFRFMTSNVTMTLNTLLGTRGACWTIASACSSGGHAVGQAADLIALGRQERVICGGSQEISWQSMCSFDGLGAFSTRVDAPAGASRPFDAARDGLVPSGGAAALVLERLDLAERRGAAILGEVLSYGFSSDGMHLSVPSGEGLERAMERALRGAGVAPGEIDYISAHATSTPAGDSAEAGAIAALFGPRTPPTASMKGLTGHELWMSGAAQVVYAAIMAREGFLAGNANFSEPDEQSRQLNIPPEPVPGVTARHVLCNSAGFGGTNACLVLRFSP